MNGEKNAPSGLGRSGPPTRGSSLRPLRRPGSRFGLVLFCLAVAAMGPARAQTPRLPPLGPDKPFLFAVLGDNRGDDSGLQPPAFLEILQAVRQADPAFVLNTGDMIYGRTLDEARVRDQWRLYREAISTLKVPVFHVPGNHDLWDQSSARLYQDLWGPTYFSFDYGRARFIGLDTETDPSRIGPAQFQWLKRQLEQAGPRIVFVFLHQPLFPRDGAIGSSLDFYPAGRDQLHRLFVKHRRAIEGVFLGHEHFYHFHQRDGIPYYITGGGGANLYMAPELGGFHHFLLVRVAEDTVSVELKKVGAPVSPLQPPRRIAPGELLESWEQGLFWFAWNYTVTAGITSDRASEGRRGLQLNFDLAQCPWPVLSLPLPSPWDCRNLDAFAVDLYLPPELPGSFLLAAGLEGAQKHDAPPVRLQPGWNTVRTAVDNSWFPAADRTAVRGLGWNLTSAETNRLRGSVVFDNFRVERAGPGSNQPGRLLEGWERPLFWRVADESVLAETTPQPLTEGTHSLKLHLDFLQCLRPVLLARLASPWDLTGVGSLTVDVYLPADLPGRLSITLGLRAGEAEYPAPPVSLKPGWNKVKVALDGRWLPGKVRAAAEQVEWTLESPSKTLRGWIAFDNLRAEK